MARYTVNQLDNITGMFPEAQERAIGLNQIASWSEFWRAAILDAETGQTLAQRVDAVVSDDPLSGCWIGIANGGDYAFAELEMITGSPVRTAAVGLAIETYLNDPDYFASCT